MTQTGLAGRSATIYWTSVHVSSGHAGTVGQSKERTASEKLHGCEISGKSWQNLSFLDEWIQFRKRNFGVNDLNEPCYSCPRDFEDFGESISIDGSWVRILILKLEIHAAYLNAPKRTGRELNGRIDWFPIILVLKFRSYWKLKNQVWQLKLETIDSC
jgi:hypothetical protein